MTRYIRATALFIALSFSTGASALQLYPGLATGSGYFSGFVWGWAPGTFTPPEAPKTVTVNQRETDSLQLTWHDINLYEDGYQVFRETPGGWILLGYDDSGAEWPVFTDSGLSADTRYCYKVRAYGANGYSPFSSPRCAYTRDGIDNPVWRVVLTLRTFPANLTHPGTDDPVAVMLNPVGAYGEVPANNLTWLDYARDDFEGSSTWSYDLNLNSVQELEDITTLIIRKDGDDAWCLRDLSLAVNGQEVYAESFEGEPGECLWLNDDDAHPSSYIVPHATLRNHPLWLNYNPALALLDLAHGIPRDELVSRLEATVGHTIHDNALYWGESGGIAITRNCPTDVLRCPSVHVDIDLAADAGIAPDPAVHIGFDLNFSCAQDGLSIRSSGETISADSDWLWELGSLWLIELLDHHVAGEVRDGWSSISRTIDAGVACEVYVDPAGTVQIAEVEPAPVSGATDAAWTTFLYNVYVAP